MNTRLFVYGTLKRGCCNHDQIAGQDFLGVAVTPPGFRLYDLGGYPAIVTHPNSPTGVLGEVWSVDPEGLERLDRFEGVHEGLYRREAITLLPPFAGQAIEVYVSALPVVNRPDVGSEWIE
jgi:gamma-glutamylaminecyclotransferase